MGLREIVTLRLRKIYESLLGGNAGFSTLMTEG